VFFRLVFCWLFTKPRRSSMSSGQCPCGSSTAAIAATTWEAKFPAFWDAEPRVTRASFLIFALVSLLRLSHLFE